MSNSSTQEKEVVGGGGGRGGARGGSDQVLDRQTMMTQLAKRSIQGFPAVSLKSFTCEIGLE